MCWLHQRRWVERSEEVAARHIVSEICQTPLTLSLSLDVCSLYVCVYTFIYITPPV